MAGLDSSRTHNREKAQIPGVEDAKLELASAVSTIHVEKPCEIAAGLLEHVSTHLCRWTADIAETVVPAVIALSRLICYGCASAGSR
jgi:hypothetical protein